MVMACGGGWPPVRGEEGERRARVGLGMRVRVSQRAKGARRRSLPRGMLRKDRPQSFLHIFRNSGSNAFNTRPGVLRAAAPGREGCGAWRAGF